MKTPEQIRDDIKFLKEEKTKKGKPKSNAKKIKVLVELIKVVRFMKPEKVKEERIKLINSLEKREALFPEFLERFSDFKLKDKEAHKKSVRTMFNKEFSISKTKERINNLNYLLD